MIIYGFAKDYQYANDGTFQVQVRIPSIHGPYKQQSGTKQPYVKDSDLPWLTSMLLPHLPNEGDVVMLESVNSSKSSEYVVIGLTGGSYLNGSIIS